MKKTTLLIALFALFAGAAAAEAQVYVRPVCCGTAYGNQYATSYAPTYSVAQQPVYAAGTTNLRQGNVRAYYAGNCCGQPVVQGCSSCCHATASPCGGQAVCQPAIAYQPVANADLDDQFPNALSHRAFRLEEVLERVRVAVVGELAIVETPESQWLLQHHIVGLEASFACERILDVLEDAGYAENPPPRPALPRHLYGWLYNQLRTAGKLVNRRRKGHRHSQDYHDHRYPPLSIDEIRARVARLGAQLGRFEKIRIEGFNEHIFRIGRAR